MGGNFSLQFFRLATIMRIPCGAKWFKRARNPTQEVRRCTIPEKGGCSMTGIYQHTLDAKGRLFIPAKLREELGETFYVTISPEKCLSAYIPSRLLRVFLLFPHRLAILKVILIQNDQK